MSSGATLSADEGRFRVYHCWFLILILGLAPLPLGSIHPWALSIFAICVVVQLLVLLPSAINDGHDWQIPGILWAAALLLTGVVAWIQIQQIPGFAPELEAEIWNVAAGYGLDVESRIAMANGGGEFELLRLLTALGIFMIAFVIGQSRRQANLILSALFWIIVAYGLLGILQLITGERFSERLYAYPGSLVASFVNRNHTATFLNIGLLIGLAKLIEPTFRQDGTEQRERWSTLFVQAISSLFEERPALTLTVAFLFVCSVATLSRGGLLSVAIAGSFLLVLGLRHILLGGGRGWFILLGTIVLFALLLWFGGEGLLARFDDIGGQLDTTTAGRFAIYTLTIELINQQPWTGYGYGLYDQLFSFNRDERFFLFFDYAHNDWLQLAVEIGLPAAIAFWTACLLVFWTCLRGVFTRRRGQLPALVAVAVLVLVGLHALVDFSLAMPAIMGLVACVSALGCAQAYRKSASKPKN